MNKKNDKLISGMESKGYEASNHHPIPFIIFIINLIFMCKIINSIFEFIKFNLELPLNRIIHEI